MDNTAIKAGSPPSPSVQSSITKLDRPPLPAPTLQTRERKNLFLRCLSVVASLRITVVLFALAMVLVFYGTWAQREASIQRVLQDYFRSKFIVWIPLKVVLMYSYKDIGGSVPFPGGWLLGGLLLCNLLAAHAIRFKISWKRAGILLIHSGLIVMMLGEVIAGTLTHEGHMSIMEGTSIDHVDNMHQAELAVVDRSDAEKDNEVVVRGQQLAKGTKIQHVKLPFDIEIVDFQANSDFIDFDSKTDKNLANRGIGVRTVAVAKAETAGAASEQRFETPSAYVRFTDKTTGKDLGTYLVSTYFSYLQRPMEELTVGGKRYSIALRFERSYRDFSIELIKFRHDKYLGTDTPKNYSSDVVVVDPAIKEPRAVKIYMNHPLYYNGETFYQAEVYPWAQGTVLQVVRNPGWTLPYLSCFMVTFGMLVHFGVHLISFLQRRFAI